MNTKQTKTNLPSPMVIPLISLPNHLPVFLAYIPSRCIKEEGLKARFAIGANYMDAYRKYYFGAMKKCLKGD
jgi:hypothetical protein